MMMQRPALEAPRNASCRSGVGAAPFRGPRHASRSRTPTGVVSCAAPGSEKEPSRRQLLQSSAAVLLASTLGGAPPLLAAESREEPKQRGMTADQMLQKIKEDFQQRQYYVTGKTLRGTSDSAANKA